jgi:hypothetical protein
MRVQLAGLVLSAALVSNICAGASPSSWQLTRSQHFELYSEVGGDRARQLAGWFEQLRSAFLNQSLVQVGAIPTVRVIAFSSAKDYDTYRVNPFADGLYAHTKDRYYILMVRGADERRIAAHEMAHVLLTASGAKMPLCFNEGLAEFFSTIHIDQSGSEAGADFAERRRTLARGPWTPLAELVRASAESTLHADRQRADLFYAQSWLLADMLVLSPQYGRHFQELFDSVGSGTAPADAFRSVFGKSMEEVDRDLHAWLGARSGARPIRLAAGFEEAVHVETSELTDFEVEALLAEVSEAVGQLDRSGAMLRALALKDPRNPRIPAALGALALRQGDQQAARKAWKQALDQGLADADIAYRYAMLADLAGLPPEEVRSALERAIALRPDFDDARYKLALLQKSAGEFAVAIGQLRAMRAVDPSRAFVYWMAMSDSLNELDRREEAIDAAHRARQAASTSDDRALADRLAYQASTDFAVQFARDSSGRAAMISTRVPRESSADWNPFVEAGDDVRTVEGALREIDCEGPATRIRLDASGAALTLAIQDPSRVRMRNAPEEFVCGLQENVAVHVQYAARKTASADGLVRGIDFKPSPPLEK